MNEGYPELDRECEECHGEGSLRPNYMGLNGPLPPQECYNCEGFGRVPTEFGQKVMEFVVGRLRVDARLGGY